MSTYAHFARFYDALTQNVGYQQRAAYFHRLITLHGHPGGLLLDLGCGTGSLSVELAALGYEVIGADASQEMLSVAMQKAMAAEHEILFLCQSMEQLDLYGTVDNCICALDSLNHLPDEAALSAAFSRLRLFIAPGGLLLFDVNTPYKHREILGNNTFVYDTPDVYCVWQNTYHTEHDRVEICLDFFVPQNNNYLRLREQFSERIFTCDTIRTLVVDHGFRILDVYGDDGFDPPGDTTQRLVYAAKRED